MGQSPERIRGTAAGQLGYQPFLAGQGWARRYWKKQLDLLESIDENVDLLESIDEHVDLLESIDEHDVPVVSVHLSVEKPLSVG